MKRVLLASLLCLLSASAFALEMAGVKLDDRAQVGNLPGAGTRISVNGAEKGIVEGAEFYRALLKIWLGGKPVDEELKKGMLGG